ncbi:hypothetical protein EI94DRAFT_1699482 [Lactarius quietus]|nr:hypothetical protein EI94DRAFT_1699482 [Lactarius quietus]
MDLKGGTNGRKTNDPGAFLLPRYRRPRVLGRHEVVSGLWWSAVFALDSHFTQLRRDAVTEIYGSSHGAEKRSTENGSRAVDRVYLLVPVSAPVLAPVDPFARAMYNYNFLGGINITAGLRVQRCCDRIIDGSRTIQRTQTKQTQSTLHGAEVPWFLRAHSSLESRTGLMSGEYRRDPVEANLDEKENSNPQKIGKSEVHNAVGTLDHNPNLKAGKPTKGSHLLRTKAQCRGRPDGLRVGAHKCRSALGSGGDARLISVPPCGPIPYAFG